MPLQKILKVSEGLLFFSAVMDIIVFITLNYHVPSWVISAMSIGSIGLIEALRRTIKK